MGGWIDKTQDLQETTVCISVIDYCDHDNDAPLTLRTYLFNPRLWFFLFLEPKPNQTVCYNDDKVLVMAAAGTLQWVEDK